MKTARWYIAFLLVATGLAAWVSVRGWDATPRDGRPIANDESTPPARDGPLTRPAPLTVVPLDAEAEADPVAADSDPGPDDAPSLRPPGEIPLRGRVVTAERRRGVARAAIDATWTRADGEESRESASAGGDGRFTIHAPDADCQHLTVRVSDAEGVGADTHAIDGPFPAGRDLGDFSMAAFIDLAITVTGTAGQPLAGAVATSGVDFLRASARSSADGVAHLRVDQRDERIRVGALGYQVREIPVQADLSRTPTVVLERGNQLTIRIRDASGQPVPDTRLRVRCASELFPGPDAGIDRCHMEAGATDFVGVVGVPGFDGRFLPDAKGVVVMTGVRTDLPLTLEAIDHGGQALASAELTLGADEWRELDLTVARVTGVVTGKVVDESGAPVRGVTVAFFNATDRAVSGANPRLTRSSSALPTIVRGSSVSHADGIFELRGVPIGPVCIGVQHPQYLGPVALEIDVPASRPVTISVRRSHLVVVKVMGPDGAPLPAETVLAHAGTRVTQANSIPEGWSFAAPPDGTIRIDAIIDGRIFSIEQPASRSEATITVATLGSVVVRYEPPPGSCPTIAVALTAEDGHATHRRVLMSATGSAREVRFRAVVPGTWQIWAECVPEGQSSAPPLRLTAPRPVEIQAGETATVTLGP